MTEGGNVLKIGVAILMGTDLEQKLSWAKGAGFDECQLQLWDMSYLNQEHAEHTKKLLDQAGMRCTGLWCGWHGPIRWNFREGPAVLGIVPTEFRATRTQNLLDGARYARALGVLDIITHLGFVPSNCSDPAYIGVVHTLQYILEQLKPHGQRFLMETGQEPPVVLKRLIEDVGSSRLLVNYDPANLMMYGNSDPIAGLDILGPYVTSVHAKDGSYPTQGYELGQEFPIGKGQVDIPKFIEKLKQIGYQGPLSIEHEISTEADTQNQDILDGKAILEALL